MLDQMDDMKRWFSVIVVDVVAAVTAVGEAIRTRSNDVTNVMVDNVMSLVRLCFIVDVISKLLLLLLLLCLRMSLSTLLLG